MLTRRLSFFIGAVSEQPLKTQFTKKKQLGLGGLIPQSCMEGCWANACLDFGAFTLYYRGAETLHTTTWTYISG